MELAVKVIAAKGFPSQDLVGKSDPYCKLGISGSKKAEKSLRTKTQKNNDNPVWNEEFKFQIPEYPNHTFWIQMWDEDVLKDDAMGRLDIPLVQIPAGHVIDSWIPLKPTKSCSKPGEIHIALHLYPKEGQPWVSAPFTPLSLNVTVVSARDIAKMDLIGSTDAYCILGIQGQERSPWKTSVKKNNMKPVWNESCSFPITNPLLETLHILMRDEDVASDDDMATLDVKLADLVNNQLHEKEFAMHPVKGVKKGGLLTLKLQLVPLVISPDTVGLHLRKALTTAGINLEAVSPYWPGTPLAQAGIPSFGPSASRVHVPSSHALPPTQSSHALPPTQSSHALPPTQSSHALPPTQSSHSLPSGPPPEAAPPGYPPPGYPPSGAAPPGYPPPGAAPPGYPPPGYPPPGYMPYGYPSYAYFPGYPPGPGFPPPGYPPGSGAPPGYPPGSGAPPGYPPGSGELPPGYPLGSEDPPPGHSSGSGSHHSSGSGSHHSSGSGGHHSPAPGHHHSGADAQEYPPGYGPPK